MKLEWQYSGPPIRLQNFLRRVGFSRIQLNRLKYQGGLLFVNRRERHTNFTLHQGDTVWLKTAPEKVADSVVPVHSEKLNIAYEDDYLLVVNKPAGVASIPDRRQKSDSLANWVKAYLLETKSESAAVHVVTRLDRDTSGLMLFAKHGFVHSLLDRQLHSRDLKKQYIAVTSNKTPLPPHGWIVLPIGRRQEFMRQRGVVLGGKKAVSEYERLDANEQAAAFLVTLHTGRTHQIRVHFAALNHRLFGDVDYGGDDRLIARQALHCAHLDFVHPMTQERLQLNAKLPEDITRLLEETGLIADSF